jgi:hypothetical protein
LSSTPLRNTFEMQKKDVNEKFDGKTFCAQWEHGHGWASIITWIRSYPGYDDYTLVSAVWSKTSKFIDYNNFALRRGILTARYARTAKSEYSCQVCRDLPEIDVIMCPLLYLLNVSVEMKDFLAKQFFCKNIRIFLHNTTHTEIAW